MDEHEPTFWVDVRGNPRPNMARYEGLMQESFEYADAVAAIGTEIDILEADGWTINHGWASSGNYYAVQATKGTRELWFGVEREENDA